MTCAHVRGVTGGARGIADLRLSLVVAGLGPERVSQACGFGECKSKAPKARCQGGFAVVSTGRPSGTRGTRRRPVPALREGGRGERVNHVGFVERYNPDDQAVHTVECNTHSAGSREGGGVFRRERRVVRILRFVMYGI